MLTRTILALGLATGVLAAPAATLGAEARVCVVDGVEGDQARYWHAGAWSDLAVALALPAEAKVSTGAGSRVRILCSDRTVVTIGAETEVNLEDLVGAGGPRRSAALQLIEGIIGLVVPRGQWAHFEVRTPVAIASVRSTEWLVEWHAGQSAAVFVRTGRVAVRGLHGERFALDRGEGITISAAGVAGEVKQWGAARIAKSTEMLGFDWR